MEVKTTEEIAKLLAVITVTPDEEGTFVVRENGKPVTRWTTRERAERSAAHMRRYNADALMNP